MPLQLNNVSRGILLFFTFSLFFLIHFTYFLLLSIPSFYTIIVPLHFQARGHIRLPNLGLVCSVHFVLSVSLDSNEPLDPFLFWVAAEQKGARVEVDISLAFLHWVGIVLHPWPFVSDIAIFVLKRDVKLQLTNCPCFPVVAGALRLLRW